MMKRASNRYSRVTLGAASILAISAYATPAFAQSNETQQIAIEAQPLSDALIEVSERYDVSIIVPDELTRGRTAAAIEGDLTVTQALRNALRGSGLTFQSSPGGAYLIVEFASVEGNQIVVTGQQIDRTLQETKESVALITAETIEQRTLLDIEDALLQVPNVAATLDGSFNVTIRGVSRLPFATGGTGDNSTTFYDDVAITNNAIRFISQNLWDVEQIEFLRGPQSTNVGRNALIGALVIRTNDPKLDEFEGAARVELGNFDTYAFEGMINIPVSANTAIRITGERSDTDGFIDNPTLGIDDFGGTQFSTLRGKILTEFSDRFRAVASIQYVDGEIGSRFYPVSAEGPLDTFLATANERDLFTYEGTTGSLSLEYELSEQWALQSITAYSQGDFTRLTDFDASEIDGGFNQNATSQFNISQELKARYNGGRLQGVIGGYFLHDESESSFVNNLSVAPGAAGVPALLVPFYPPVLTLQDFDDFDRETTNLAIYTQWDFNVSDRLRLSAGLRFDRESFDLKSIGESIFDLSQLPDPVEAAALSEMQQPGSGPAVQGGITGVNNFLLSFVSPPFDQTLDASFDALLPEFGVTYEFSPDIQASLFYKRGYRAGGAEIVLGDLNEFDPEFIDNFEASVRSEWLNGALILNANAYYGFWSDQQLSVPVEGNPNIVFTENAGKSRIWGFEFEASYQPSRDTELFAGLGYARTRFSDFCSINSTEAGLPDCTVNGVNGKDLSGNEFAVSPSWTASFGGQQYLFDRFYAQANFTYQSGSFSDVENRQRLETEDFFLANASAGYRSDAFDVRLFVRNLFDVSYQLRLTDFPPDQLGVISGIPREYGVIVGTRF